MKRSLLILAVLVLTINGWSQRSAANTSVAGPQPTPLPAKTTLKARVYYEDTGRPVRRMAVMLLPQSSGGEFSGVTDALGNLEIRNVRAGKYYPLVNAPGVVTPLAYIDIRNSRDANIIDQLSAIPTIEVNGLTNASVEIAAKRGGAVTGRIVYADGDPAIGVKVEILRKVGDEYLPTIPNFSSLMGMGMGGVLGGMQTDDRGVYRFSGLPDGEYLVKVTENVVHADTNDKMGGYGALLGGIGSMVSVFFENAFRPADAQAIKLQLGQEVSEVNIVIPDRALHSVSGKVVAAKDRLPVRGATLRIKILGDTTAQMPEELRLEQTVTTDGEGKWQFRELPKGKYQVTVEPGSSEFDPKAQAYGNDPNSGFSNANFAAQRAMNAVNSAVYAVNAPRRGVTKPPPPELSKASKEFDIEDDDVAEQVVELTTGATVIGTVTFENGATPNGSVMITAKSDAGDLEKTQNVYFYDYTDEEAIGRSTQKEFRVSGISPGKTSFTIKPNNGDFYVKSAVSNQVDLLAGSVELKSGETLANVRIVLSNETGTVKGKMLDEDKQPIAGRKFTFVPTDKAKARNETYYREVTTDANGEFEVKLPPFEYAVIFFAEAPKPLPDDWLVKAVSDAQTVQVEAGSTSALTIKRTSKKEKTPK